MNVKVVIRVVSAILVVVGVAMATSVLVALAMGDDHSVVMKLLESSLMPTVVGLLGVLLTPKDNTIQFREGFGIVTFSWLFAAIFGAIPFTWVHGIAPVDAFFETMSGFTTTGASILNDIESLPHGLLYWRSLTHWLGGMGIVVLSLAVMPILGIGGMQLYKAEAPGPTSDQLTPRVANTAKMLWGVYVLISVAETLLLWAGPMTLFEAWTHTCGTVATGGFSTRQASVFAFRSAYVDWVITFFMVLAGTNFVLHLRLLTGRPLAYFKDEEFRFYLSTIIFGVVTVSIALFMAGRYEGDLLTILRHSAFTVVSIMTTTGFATEDFDLWPTYCKVLLVCLMFVGGCGGSTAGGMKVSRMLLLLKYGVAQMRRALYPRVVTNVQLDNSRVGDTIMSRILGFFFIYICIFVLVTVLICVVEPNLTTTNAAFEARGVETALTASVATLCNIGPGLAAIGPYQNFSWMAPVTKLILTIAMLVGRLEVYTVLVILLPVFWKR